MPDYVFDNTAVQARDRFAALEAVYDVVTTARLTELGVGPGWRCLEVGAGGGSIARWLAEQVGPTGSVLATDIEPSRLRGLEGAVEVRRHDVAADELPTAAFDLVHARLVLLHLPERVRALRRMYAALRPGGLLVLDEFDCTYLPALDIPDGASAQLFAKVTGAIHHLIDVRGGDPAWGRHAFAELRRAGFADVAQRSHSESWPAGSAGARLHRANAVQVRDELIERRLVTPAELERFLALLEQPGVVFNSYLMYTIWGRKPD